MSFRLFIYYCAVCGGWAALVGWSLGQLVAPSKDDLGHLLLRQAVLGMWLGMLVALGLGLVDALWNLSGRFTGQVVRRGLLVAVLGCVAGLAGSTIGQALVGQTGWDAFVILGWTLTGLLVGGAIGLYDTALQFGQGRAVRGTLKKAFHGVLGGALGGFLGSLLFLLIRAGLSGALGKPAEELLSSSAAGFVALGACIGLFIGLAQVILKEAWLRVESGFRAGRELILSKEEITIGRAESCDVGLFGDSTVERLHARILRQRHRHLLADAGTLGGTFLNDARITQPTPLRSGDRIRVGQSVLFFGERPKKTARRYQTGETPLMG